MSVKLTLILILGAVFLLGNGHFMFSKHFIKSDCCGLAEEFSCKLLTACFMSWSVVLPFLPRAGGGASRHVHSCPPESVTRSLQGQPVRSSWDPTTPAAISPRSLCRGREKRWPGPSMASSEWALEKKNISLLTPWKRSPGTGFSQVATRPNPAP